jgi:hypothetical protein
MTVVLNKSSNNPETLNFKLINTFLDTGDHSSGAEFFSKEFATPRYCPARSTFHPEVGETSPGIPQI